jgi:hypothetical protein
MTYSNAFSDAAPQPSQAAIEDLAYIDFLAAVKARFGRMTAPVQGNKVHLFVTDTPDLFDRFLASLPASIQAESNCNSCRNFFQQYGNLVIVTPEGQTQSILWDVDLVPDLYKRAIARLAEIVNQAPITGMFLSMESQWGTAVAGGWQHLAVQPLTALIHRDSPVQTLHQVLAEKLQHHAMLRRSLQDYGIDLVQQARDLLVAESLYQSQRCLGVANWFLNLHQQIQSTRNTRLQNNLIWLAVAEAPPGFCSVRSTMIGTLLDDLAAGLPFGVIKARFEAKMNPLQYQRPTADPKVGNINDAERIIAQLGSANAFARRFARLSDIQADWIPALPATPAAKSGVFAHLLPKDTSQSRTIELPPVTITWEKFARTVLPTAAQMEYWVPADPQPYIAMVTAQDEMAPPIVQWDSDRMRNPVTWYFYTTDLSPDRWNLKANTYCPITAITLQPSMWHRDQAFAHHGEKVFLLLQDAKDIGYVRGAGLFVSQLKSDYYPIRATLEAHIKTIVIADRDQAQACGLGLQKGNDWNCQIRVTTQAGLRAVYRLDRWD